MTGADKAEGSQVWLKFTGHSAGTKRGCGRAKKEIQTHSTPVGLSPHGLLQIEMGSMKRANEPRQGKGKLRHEQPFFKKQRRNPAEV